jgi:hypothetical protein
MMFSGGIFLAAGATIALAVLDKTFEEFGVHWLGTAVKIVIPVVGLLLGVYFLENNPITLWWLK